MASDLCCNVYELCTARHYEHKTMVHMSKSFLFTGSPGVVRHPCRGSHPVGRDAQEEQWLMMPLLLVTMILVTHLRIIVARSAIARCINRFLWMDTTIWVTFWLTHKQVHPSSKEDLNELQLGIWTCCQYHTNPLYDSPSPQSLSSSIIWRSDAPVPESLCHDSANLLDSRSPLVVEL
jgi:hypothetical protein